MPGWLLTFTGYDPTTEGIRETLCTLANGYWGTRGCAPHARADGVHYPGTYLAGVYNRLDSTVADLAMSDESIVNTPNWLPLTVQHADGTPIDPDHGTLDFYEQQLDLHRGLLRRTFVHRDATGRTTRITHRQLVSLPQPHVAALETTVEALNWSGDVCVHSGLDGDVTNSGVAEYQGLAGRHLEPDTPAQPDGDLLLATVTSRSRIRLALAARTTAYSAGIPLERRPTSVSRGPLTRSYELHLEVAPSQPVTIEKVAAVATSRDPAIETPAQAALAHLAAAGPFAALLAEHERAWAALWDDFAIDLTAGDQTCLPLHLDTFHVVQTAHTDAGIGTDAGLPARGLHGEGYHGHVFWDEMFVYPMLTLRRPELTRDRLVYRYRRLPAARAAAAATGRPGAMFPWQSGGDGTDVTPTHYLNVRSGQWLADTSHRQRHAGLAVAYSVIQYHQATADLAFLTGLGGELLVEICRFFAALPVYDPHDGRYHIDGAMGPDEFHDGYPGRPGIGVRDNAYTNVLGAWLLHRTADLLTVIDRHDFGRLRRRLQVTAEELHGWDRLSRRLAVPWHADGVLSQFDGYEHLPELDWAAYRARYPDISRLDLILAAEGDSTDNYRVGKQADTLMLFYLLSAEDLRATLHRLGYRLPGEAVRATVDFYTARTSHGSTLSRIVHAWVNARADRPRAWRLFTEALRVDLADTPGGTTREGVHLGAMAGTVDLIVRCLAGVETRDDSLWVHPVLPPEMAHVAFTVMYRSQRIEIDITPERVRLHLTPCDTEPITVHVHGRRMLLRPGDLFEAPAP